MTTRSRLTSALLCCLAALLLAPGLASAGSKQESTFQDDDLLVYGKPAAVSQIMDRLKAMGVDRLRISLQWALVAPVPKAQQEPAGFDATNPAAYPTGAWDRYDTLVLLARAKGLELNFDVTSPAPAWATGSLAGRPDLDKNFDPDPDEFGAFVRAAATRYSGRYVAPGTGATALPRVGYWTVWNEPNQPGWLTPQWVTKPGRGLVEASPRIYRSLVDEMFDALAATGHAKDTLLIGETSPSGQERVKGPTRAIKPGRFLRRLYCLDDDLQLLTGSRAKAVGCPGAGSTARFAAAHPGLFRATGYAHHPYELTFSPTTLPKPDNFTTANLPALSTLLRRINQRYGQRLPGGGRDVPLYLTEYGSETNPPDPAKNSFATQAAYLNQVEWLTYRNPVVRTLSQFLLVDDAPTPGIKNPIEAYGGTFQSGLITLQGKVKPSLAAYVLPIFLPVTKVARGKKLRVFGLVRPAVNGKAPRVRLQVRGTGGAFKTVKTVTGTAARGYVDTTFAPARSGVVRLAWSSGGAVTTSRSVAFSVRR